MKFEVKLRILDKANELIAVAKSIAGGSKPAARRKLHLNVGLTLHYHFFC